MLLKDKKLPDGRYVQKYWASHFTDE